ncbi:hypothetical protein [Pseudidiomarina woesei]|uniref:Pyridine nucleotide-disulphide oxidoreductase n=1 Tax=Pseudidiomarina woesei TaxID=1381080 RepID=A0A0K6H3Q5_9GAMM|nr:hypothetical protein [Pseudidiomarina woesei]CUA85588.1 hypothetical protein Ga0061064_1254 [Pseudidiomarina woesei]
MAKVVVVGTELGGVTVAYELREKLTKGTDILVIGEGSEFNFVPSNPWLTWEYWRRFFSNSSKSTA